jgi:hypothetical protein
VAADELEIRVEDNGPGIGPLPPVATRDQSQDRCVARDSVQHDSVPCTVVGYVLWLFTGRGTWRRLGFKGHDHQRAIRTLARAWSRIVWRCWQDGVPYELARHRAAQRHITVTIPNPSGDRVDVPATQRVETPRAPSRVAFSRCGRRVRSIPNRDDPGRFRRSPSRVATTPSA